MERHVHGFGRRVTVGIAVVAIAAATGAGAAMSVYAPPERVAARAPLVVRGVVLETASGFDPSTARLSTYVTIDVREVVRGPNHTGTLVVREPGGRFLDLVHHVDAVPIYRAGEDVVAVLEPAADGTLRTAGMFFGKFTVRPPTGADSGPVAERDLDGAGRIVGRSSSEPERWPLDVLERRLTTAPPGGAARDVGRTWLAAPPELDRLLWSDVRSVGAGGPARAAASSPRTAWGLEAGVGVSVDRTTFAPLSSSSPARWYETDTGGTVTVDIERARNPLADPQAAVDAIVAATDAWTDVPESRLHVAVGNDDVDYTATHASSPASSYPSGSVVLFGDPYDDISDPDGCSGTLAIGGYWRSGVMGPAINGTTFYRALRAYVIFNDGFECFLGNPDNLAEVATHELGHAIGLGHSNVPDAVMRSYAYGGGRGARLGDDDRDAAHCVYPHVLQLTSPADGDVLTAGDAHAVTWTATAETGLDPGEVDLEYSPDDGASWIPVTAATPNDGHHVWTVPLDPGEAYRFRVARPNRVVPAPAGWPSACSGDGTAGTFAVVSPPASAGAVPDGAAGAPVRLDRDGAGAVRIVWDPSCAAGATDYAVYRGQLDDLRSGTWAPTAESCSTGGATGTTVPLPEGDVFYLVAPLAGGSEGRFGSDSSGLDRPPAPASCAPRESSSVCN